MLRSALALLSIGLLVPACGGDEGEKAAKAQEALTALRPAYSHRIATIRSVQEQARWWKGRAGVPAIALGQRPLPQFTLEPVTAAPLKGTNGRILEPDEKGGWGAPGQTLVLGDTTWMRDIDERMRGQGVFSAAGVQHAFERFDDVRYLRVLVADTFLMPKGRSGSQVVFSMEFETGLWQGKLLLFDVTTAELLGGTELTATNAEKVDFKVKEGGSVADDEKAGQLAFEADLRRRLLAAVDQALGALVSVESAAPASTSKSHEVWLLTVGERKVEVIREVRALTGLGLKDAKDLVEAAPKLGKGGLARAEAEALRKVLGSAGAIAEVR